MSFAFLNPLFLIGLAAGILPIVIHRLTRKKAIRRQFSAVRLLIHSQQLMARPQRLKDLLLLLLRIAAVISLVLLVARPLLIRPGLLALGAKNPTVVVIDNSLSMGYKEGERDRYDIARKAAGEIITSLAGQVMVIPTAYAEGARAPDNTLRWVKPEEALKELMKIPLVPGRGDPGQALADAFAGLKEAKAAGEIVVLSDMARGDWDPVSPARISSLTGETHITFLRIGGERRDPNLAIRKVVFPEGDPVAGTPVPLGVTVSNLSDRAASTVVQIYTNQARTDQKSIDLKPGEDGEVTFGLFFDKPGWVNGEARLSGDLLAADDLFYFPLKVREKVRLLVVDGDPKGSSRAGESYYLVSALQPGDGGDSPFAVKVVTEAELGGVDQKTYDVLLLLNVAGPPQALITAFLGARKPVFLFLGNRVVPASYNALPAFPWRLRGVRDGAERPETVAEIDYSRECLRQFAAAGSESLRGARFRSYFQVERPSKSLLTLGNRDPLLLESDMMKGKIFLYTSSADLDWNDLPLKAAYLPLIQGLVKEAAGLTGNAKPSDTTSDRPFAPGSHPFQVTGKTGGLGIYGALLSSGEARRAVNPPPEESDLAKISEKDIRRKLPAGQIRFKELQEGTLAGLEGNRRELWPFFLAFLLTLLVVEMGVANKK